VNINITMLKALPALIFIYIVIVQNTLAAENTKSAEVSEALSLEAVADSLPKSWAIAVSPNNQLFMTERSGVLHQFAIDEQNALAQLNLTYSIDLALNDLYAKGQGGLLAIAFAPDYVTDPWLYLSYSFGTDDANGLKVIRLKLAQGEVVAKEVVFTQSDLRDTPVHYGARLAFKNDGSLLITTGDGFDYREQAQVADSHLGKIIQVQTNGETTIYSTGHRNPQGLVVLANDLVVSHEHGAEGGDEINIIERGVNYGWPVITQGRDYLGGLITPFTEYKGMQQPGFDWTPSMAPSGMVFYSHSRISELTGRLLITSLKFQQLHSVTLNDNVFGNEVIYFAKSGHRMRDLTQTQSGRVFILSDGAGSDASTQIFEVVSN
jgi:glucose/arabinose dehydrogenase